MKRLLRQYFVFLLLLPLISILSSLSPAAVADGFQTFSVKLNIHDRMLLEQVVCGQKLGLAVAEIDAQAFEASARQANFADVKCRPHTQLNGKPLYFVAQCAREGAQWSCGRPELETIVTLKDRELVVRPGTVDPKVAYDALQKISGYGFFQGQSIDRALQSTCNMGMGDTPDLIEISCKRWSVTVSFWCPQTSATSACPRVIYMGERP